MRIKKYNKLRKLFTEGSKYLENNKAGVKKWEGVKANIMKDLSKHSFNKSILT